MQNGERLTPEDERVLSYDERARYNACYAQALATHNTTLISLVNNETMRTVTRRKLRQALAERDALRAKCDALQAEVSQLRQDLATLRVLAMRNNY